MKQSLPLPRMNPSAIYFLGILLVLSFLAVLFSNLSVSMNSWQTFTTVFLGIFIEAVPFLLLGTLASGMVEVFVDRDVIRRLVPASPVLGVLVGCFMGLLFPVCECGVVPLVRRLLRKGLPIPAGIAFLLAAPVINPVTILSTAAAFGFGNILWMRIGFTLLIAAVTGLIYASVSTPREILQPTAWIQPDDNTDTCAAALGPQGNIQPLPEKARRVLQVTLDEFFEIGRYLILGGLISAGMQTFIPQTVLLDVGKGPVLSVLVMMGLAVILSICSTVDSFIALGFTGLFSTGSILGFLLYGPMVDIKSILMFLRVLRPRAVAYLVVLPLVMAVLICVSLNLFWTG